MRAPRLYLAILLVVPLAAGCNEATAPAIEVHVRGTVRLDQTPVPSARVVLRDQRTESEAGVLLARATADASGRFELRGVAEREGYGSSCDSMFLYVEGFRFETELSLPLRCTTELQNIDLTVTESTAQRIPR